MLLPGIYPDTQFLLEHDILADGTEGDALALCFEMEGVAGSQLQAVAEGLGENHANAIRHIRTLAGPQFLGRT